MSRCRQRLTSMEAGVLGRQRTCAEQSKVTPLTGMPGRSMRSGRYVMLATAQTGRFSAKAQAGSLWRRLSWCRAASSSACVGSISFFSLPPPSLFPHFVLFVTYVHLSYFTHSSLPIFGCGLRARVNRNGRGSAMLAGCPLHHTPFSVGGAWGIQPAWLTLCQYD